jgi:predicted RNase H-like nuclease (RuvC/YqgF family)
VHLLKGLRYRSAENKDSWKCPDCKKVNNTGKTADDMKAFMSRLEMKMNELMTMKTAFEEVKASLEMMSAKYDEVMCSLSTQNTRVKTLEKEVNDLKIDVTDKTKKIEELEGSLRDLEQYNRNKNIEISGVEPTPNENLHNIMDKLSQSMNIDFEMDDVDVIHRVPSRRAGQIPKIIVQFKTRTSRNMWLKKKTRNVISRDVCGSGNGLVYINEHLTQHWQRLLWMTKQEGRPKGYHIIWYRDGKIFVKKNVQDTQVIRITTEMDIVSKLH